MIEQSLVQRYAAWGDLPDRQAAVYLLARVGGRPVLERGALVRCRDDGGLWLDGDAITEDGIAVYSGGERQVDLGDALSGLGDPTDDRVTARSAVGNHRQQEGNKDESAPAM